MNASGDAGVTVARPHALPFLQTSTIIAFW